MDILGFTGIYTQLIIDNGEPLTRYAFGNGVELAPIDPVGSMLLEEVGFKSLSSDPSMRYHGVVYSDRDGHPYELIALGEQRIGLVAGLDAVSPFRNALGVIAGVRYWVGIAHDRPFTMQTASPSWAASGRAFTHTYTNPPPDFAPPPAGVDTAPDDPLFLHTIVVGNIWARLTGASVFSARSYVYTWVSLYGEEGPPSPPTVLDGWSNATWTVGTTLPPLEQLEDPEGSGAIIGTASVRGIKSTRLYRTVSDQYGLATYFLVAEYPVTQLTYLDTLKDRIVTLNSQLESLYWFPPPKDMQGIVPFPNGISIGWQKNEVWFSEAYRPHAWPPGYVLTTEFDVIGVGVCGQSIVVCTKGYPYLVTGTAPGAMAMTKINLAEPCLHRGSIVSTDTSVLYISENGLIGVNQSGAASNITEGWITRERWRELTPLGIVRAVKHATCYFAFARDGFGFTIELSNQDQTSFNIWPQPGGHRLGFNLLGSPNGFEIENLQVDPWTGVCYLIQNHEIWYYDFRIRLRRSSRTNGSRRPISSWHARISRRCGSGSMCRPALRLRSPAMSTIRSRR